MHTNRSACLTTKGRAATAIGVAAATLHAALRAMLCALLAGCAAAARSVPAALPAPATRPADDRPLRWTPAHHDTLALWVDSAGVSVAGWRPDLVRIVAEAAEAWRAAGAPIRFVRTTSLADADVRVRWVAWQSGAARGTTTWSTNARGELVGADVTIVLAPGPRQPASHACVLRAIALHELGHALGLPHDRSRDAVMYREEGTLVLTDHDRAALRAAYGGAVAAARSAHAGG